MAGAHELSRWAPYSCYERTRFLEGVMCWQIQHGKQKLPSRSWGVFYHAGSQGQRESQLLRLELSANRRGQAYNRDRNCDRRQADRNTVCRSIEVRIVPGVLDLCSE